SLSKGTVPSYVRPYLLKGLKVKCSNQVWSTDISYILIEKGFMYLSAVIDVYSRFVVGWKLSNTLSANNCTDLVRECIEQYGCPRDHQLRPRRTVYEQEVGRAIRGKGNKDKYGWERTLQRQYLDRTLLEKQDRESPYFAIY
ncbi:DDE-type integrase/transposase/recombinase, partial [Porphyromonas levii]